MIWKQDPVASINSFKALWLSFFGNKKQRYEMRHRLLASFSARCGYRLYNRNLLWLHDEEFKAVWSRFTFGDQKHIHERKLNFYYIAKSIRSIPGDLAECGVFHAGSSHLMLAATEGTEKHLYGFDSFEGLSEPNTNDVAPKEETFKWKKHDMAFPEDVAANNLKEHEGRFTFYKGWIPDRFNEVEDKRFSLVHIDVDLHDPTLQSLEFFYPRMNAGGIIVCDDYGSEACPGAYKAMNDFFADKPEKSVIHLTTGQGIVVIHPK